MFHQTPHVVAAIVAATLLPIPAFAGDIEFGGFESAGPHNGLRRVALGDFNGDGILDLASVENSNPNLVIELGAGDGTFNPATSFPLSGSGGVGLVAAELTGDGVLDVAVSDIAEQISVMQGAGDGTFSELTTLATDGGFSVAIGAADLDLDGDLDLVVTPTDTVIRPFLNDGAGGFELGSGALMSSSVGTLVLEDLNGDGFPDLAVSQGPPNSPQVLVRLGAGAGGFSTTLTIIDVPADPFGLAAGDVDGDGVIDLAVPSFNSGAVSVLLGVGDGTFLDPTSHPVGNGPRDVAIVDVEGDLDFDVIALNGFDQAVSVLLSDGAGGFTLDGPYPAAGTLSLAVGDLNNDKNPDVVLGSNFGTAGVSLINITSPAAPGPPLLTSPPDASTGLPLPETLAAWPGRGCDAPIDWDPAVGFGVSYTLFIATDAGLKDIVFETSGLSVLTIDVPIGVLLPGQTYFWSVAASNSSGTAFASNGPFTFSTASAGGPDINGDGMVDAADLAALLAAWGPVF